MYPPFDICVDAQAVYDAIGAPDACEPAGSSLTLHLISVWDRMTYGLVRQFFWVDTIEVLADGLTKGGIDRLLLRSAGNDCEHQTTHEALVHTTHSSVGSATMPRLAVV